MRRRPDRLKMVQRLISPLSARIRQPIRRVRRQFVPVPLRWPVGRRLAFRPIRPDDRRRS
jgi:hypothetical protein